jgi:hypothetical protein
VHRVYLTNTSSLLRLVDLVLRVRVHVQPIRRILRAVDEDTDRDQYGGDHHEQNRVNPLRQQKRHLLHILVEPVQRPGIAVQNMLLLP